MLPSLRGLCSRMQQLTWESSLVILIVTPTPGQASASPKNVQKWNLLGSPHTKHIESGTLGPHQSPVSQGRRVVTCTLEVVQPVGEVWCQGYLLPKWSLCQTGGSYCGPDRELIETSPQTQASEIIGQITPTEPYVWQGHHWYQGYYFRDHASCPKDGYLSDTEFWQLQ